MATHERILYYKRQSPETLIDLCEQQGIDTVGKSRTRLICALIEHEREQCAREGESSKSVILEDCVKQRDLVPVPPWQKLPRRWGLPLESAQQFLGTDDPYLCCPLNLPLQQEEKEHQQRMNQLQSEIASLQPSASGSTGVSATSVEPWKCFAGNQVGHITGYCPEERRPSAQSSVESVSPAVLCARESTSSKEEVGISDPTSKEKEVGISDPTDIGGRSDNLQPVTVGDSVTVGLRVLGSLNILACPGARSSEDVIPGKARAVTGFGSAIPAVPMAGVSVNGESRNQLREVGIANPTSLLPGTVLGTGAFQVVPSTLQPERQIPDVPAMFQSVWGGQGDTERFPAPGPNGTLDRQRTEECSTTLFEYTQVLCPEVSEMSQSVGGGQGEEEYSPAPGPDGPLDEQKTKDWLPVLKPDVSFDIQSENVADCMNQIVNELHDTCPESRRVKNCVTVQPYGEMGCGSVTVLEEEKCISEISFENSNDISVKSCEKQQCVCVVPDGIQWYVGCSSVTIAMSTTMVDSVLYVTQEKLQCDGTNLYQKSHPSAAAADRTVCLQADRSDASLEVLSHCAGRPSAEEDRAEECDLGQRADVLMPMPLGELCVTSEWPYTRPKCLSVITIKLPPDDLNKGLRMMTAHNDKFACTLSVCSLWPVDEVDPQGDLLAKPDPDLLGSSGVVPRSPILSARGQTEESVVLGFIWGPKLGEPQWTVLSGNAGNPILVWNQTEHERREDDSSESLSLASL